MNNQLEEFAKASKDAACTFMGTYGEAMTRFVPYAIAGGPKVATAVTLAVGVANWAAKENCEWDPDKAGPGDDPLAPTGCMEARGNSISLFVYFEIKGEYRIGSSIKKVIEFRAWRGTNESGSAGTNVYYKADRIGEIVEYQNFYRDAMPNGEGPVKGIRADSPTDCLENFPAPPPVQPDTYQYTTEEGCTLNVNFKSLVQGADGNVGGLWQIEPAADDTRASGSVIRGCNFSPTMYYDGGGGGEPPRVFPTPIPTPPGDQWWMDLLGRALAGAAGNILASAIKDLVKPVIPESEFLFTAPCDVDEEGRQLQMLYQWPDQDYQSRVVSQQAVIMEILQQHLNWKTPICFGNDEKGSFARSITFASDENTERGNRRCTKRFGYRSDTPCELESLYEHWRNFSWSTGPVIVIHRGSALGSPQVWASSVDEGKRVIQHAAREAGVDPDQVGEWSIGGCDNPRYGVSHTVKLMNCLGHWQATARVGDSGPSEGVWTMPALEGGA